MVADIVGIPVNVLIAEEIKWMQAEWTIKFSKSKVMPTL